MNFEEFFAKKKISLAKLQEVDSSLFEKLKSEYEVMGPKSFDHYYKFLFNKWRYLFRILED